MDKLADMVESALKRYGSKNIRTMLDITLGAGRKAPGGTSNMRRMLKRYWSITDRRP